jgi:hypothetical protein
MRNLQAEMSRNGVTVADIQSLLGCAEKTARNKINSDRGEFTISEALKVRDTFFTGMRIEYLFATGDDKTA